MTTHDLTVLAWTGAAVALVVTLLLLVIVRVGARAELDAIHPEEEEFDVGLPPDDAWRDSPQEWRP